MLKKIAPEPIYAIDESAAVYDHKVLRTPPYHPELQPIETCWGVVKNYIAKHCNFTIVPDDDAVPGASFAVQTYGDFLNFNPHLHAIVSDGFFLEDGSFQTAPIFMLKDLEETFQYEVLKMLKKEGQINDLIIENMLSWYHSGFNVYIGNRIEPDDKTGIGNLDLIF